MAYNKIFALHGNLKKTIDYAANKEKTVLQEMIEYAADENKTENAYETAINCPSVEMASVVMEKTKEYWGKNNGIQGYHIIQSFLPGEGPAELIHQIGIEYANALFGDSFEVVVTTHLNKDHLHNHIVVNSVSFVDGHKLRFSEKDYYEIIQKESNRIVANYGFSVIEPSGKGRQYAEWSAEKDGKPTIRNQIRDDMDGIIKRSFTMNMFWQNLEQAGYRVNRNPRRKYITVIPPGGKKAIRLESLGDAYTESAIQNRIVQGRERKTYSHTPKASVKYYRIKGKRKFHKRKISGFEALYFRYVYLLHGKNAHPRKTLTMDEKNEVRKLEQYDRQFLFVLRNRVQSLDQLRELRTEWENTLKTLDRQRDALYKKRSRGNEEDIFTKQIEELTGEMNKLRKNLKLCGDIENDSASVVHRMNQWKQEIECSHDYRIRNSIHRYR